MLGIESVWRFRMGAGAGDTQECEQRKQGRSHGAV
jgi:hypothetical protein